MELNDILKEIGVEPKEGLQLEDVKKHLSENFVGVKVHEAAIGKTLGTIDTIAKKFDIELPEDLAKAQVTERLPKVVELVNNQIKSLKELASQNNDEKLTALQKEHEAALKKANEFKSLLDNTQAERDKLVSDYEGRLLSLKANQVFKDELAKLPLGDNVSDLAKKGLVALFNEQYQIGFENEQPILRKHDGSPVHNATGTKALSIGEVLKQMADEGQLTKKAVTPIAGQPISGTSSNNNAFRQPAPRAK